jgi:hypothetical protein
MLCSEEPARRDPALSSSRGKTQRSSGLVIAHSSRGKPVWSNPLLPCPPGAANFNDYPGGPKPLMMTDAAALPAPVMRDAPKSVVKEAKNTVRSRWSRLLGERVGDAYSDPESVARHSPRKISQQIAARGESHEDVGSDRFLSAPRGSSQGCITSIGSRTVLDSGRQLRPGLPSRSIFSQPRQCPIRYDIRAISNHEAPTRRKTSARLH